MLIQGSDSESAAFIRSNRRTIRAGTVPGLGNHEGQPAKYIDLPLFFSNQRSEIHLGRYKISKLLKLRFTLHKFHVDFSAEELPLLKFARDRLVHSGNFGNNADDEYVLQRYWMISNLLIRLLLSILNYHGPFNSRSPGYVKEILP